MKMKSRVIARVLTFNRTENETKKGGEMQKVCVIDYIFVLGVPPQMEPVLVKPFHDEVIVKELGQTRDRSVSEWAG